MIFQPAILRAILRSEVTQVRRPVKNTDPHYRRSQRLKSTSSHVLVKPFHPREGDRIPIRSSGSTTAGHVTVLAVTQQPAGSLSFEDARAMGYRTTSEAMGAWLSDYDQAWMCEPQHSVECQACGGPGLTEDGYCVTCGTSDQSVARFMRKHADRIVWVIRFELERAASERYLAETPAPDYVSSPALGLKGEGPALSVEEHAKHVEKQKRKLKEWQELERASREEEAQQRTQEARYRAAKRRAGSVGVDVSREAWMYESTLAAGRPAHMVERRLAVIERKVSEGRLGRAA